MPTSNFHWRPAQCQAWLPYNDVTISAFRCSACLLNKKRTLLLSLQAVLDVPDAHAGLPQHLCQKQWTTSMQRVAFSIDLSPSSIDCFSFSHARAYVMRCLMRRGTAAMPGQQKSHLSAKRACKCLGRCRCEVTLSSISFQVCTGPEAIVGSAERARRSRQQAGLPGNERGAGSELS